MRKIALLVKTRLACCKVQILLGDHLILFSLWEGMRGLNRHLKHIGITLCVAVQYLETDSLNKLLFANVQNCFAV